MIWHILGAGAIGSLFAIRLQQAGSTVQLLLRQPQTEDYYQLHLHKGKDTQAYRLPWQPVTQATAINHLLIATKAPDTLTALDSLASRVQPNADIVLLQNGMGQHEAVCRAFPQARIWAAVTTAGVWRPDANTLIQVSEGHTEIGSLQNAPTNMPKGWNTMTPPPAETADIYLSLWRKLAINCAINPLTARYQCRNGELVSDPQRRAVLLQLCHEIEQVTQALGLSLFDTSLADRVVHIAEQTAQNRSSMLTDLLNQRPTEIDYITGYLCQQAQQLNIHLPLNEQLLTEIKQLSVQTHRAKLGEN